MANTISYAKQYINNQVEHLNMFERNLLCADLLVRPAEIKGKTISYDKMSFASYVMGDYNRENGCSKKDLVFERVEKLLTQDKGDSLGLDIMDKAEAQISEGIMGVYNFYQVKVEVPTLDNYAFGEFTKPQSGANFIANGSSDGTNAYDKLLDGEAVLLNKRIKLGECILYVSVSFDAKLRKANLTRAFITVGAWNGSVETNITQIDGMKLVKVPDDTLGADYVIAHPLSASVVDVLAGAEYKDNIPGKVGWAQIDVRDHFDAWVEPTGGEGIVVALAKPRALKLTETATHSVAITGVEAGAKVYYKTSAGATSSDTEVEAGSDGSFAISTPQATTTFYVVQYIGGVKSDEKSITITIA